MIKAIVTDIEGTTTSLSFVKDVLFPYARNNISGFIRKHGNNPEVSALLDDVRSEIGKNLTTEAIIELLIQWIDADKKISPLKALQGLIWQNGYAKGDFKGHIYPDAAQFLQDWKARGIDLYIYSSGSVHAQKLLFSHTEYGDLTPLFSGYFDTKTGGKKESDSYRKIADSIEINPDHILFLSDIEEELSAAKASGFNTCWLIRDGNRPKCDHYSIARNFAEIAF